jgi:hypothetical protein
MTSLDEQAQAVHFGATRHKKSVTGSSLELENGTTGGQYPCTDLNSSTEGKKGPINSL